MKPFLFSVTSKAASLLVLFGVVLRCAGAKPLTHFLAYRPNPDGSITALRVGTNGDLVPIARGQVKADTRLVHLTVSPSGRYLYAATEPDDQTDRERPGDLGRKVIRHDTLVSVSAILPDGRLRLRQRFVAPYLLGSGYFHPNGRWLYFPLRGEYQAVYAAAPDGMLRAAGLTLGGGNGFGSKEDSPFQREIVQKVFARNGRFAWVLQGIEWNSDASYRLTRHPVVQGHWGKGENESLETLLAGKGAIGIPSLQSFLLNGDGGTFFLEDYQRVIVGRASEDGKLVPRRVLLNEIVLGLVQDDTVLVTQLTEQQKIHLWRVKAPGQVTLADTFLLSRVGPDVTVAVRPDGFVDLFRREGVGTVAVPYVRLRLTRAGKVRRSRNSSHLSATALNDDRAYGTVWVKRSR